MGYVYEKGAYYTCRCGGAKRRQVHVPENTTKIIFNNRMQGLVHLENGNKYLVEPFQVCLDVLTADAAELVELGKARRPTEYELRNYHGYFGKR